MNSLTGARDDENRAKVDALPLETLNPADPELFQHDLHWPYFERLRREDPVHWCPESEYGPYWSITKFKDIVEVETRHDVFSSAAELGGVTLFERKGGGFLYEKPGAQLKNFIAMDPPEHSQKRKAVSSPFTPANMAALAPLIRQRAQTILDGLPIGETFDLVERVSVELTIQNLCTLVDFPLEERQKLKFWSDVGVCIPGPGQVCETVEDRDRELKAYLDYFTNLRNERAKKPPANDLISMLAHNPATRDMGPIEYIGTLVLLIGAGNETTRNSITASVLATDLFPGEFEKLRANPGLIDSFVPEVLRWQSPVPHMRRTAIADFELRGKTIRKGDKVAMWFVSGNRDEEEFDRPDEFVVDRERPRQHLSFGMGVHRCLGARMGELQLMILWEEILKRFKRIEVVGEPERVRSIMFRGFTKLPVKIHA